MSNGKRQVSNVKSSRRIHICLLTFALCHLTLCFTAFSQSVNDSTLRVTKYVGGFDLPTGIAFLDANGTALVTEKETGKVKLVENRQITATVLDLPVANSSERGLLSIALSPHFATDK